MNASTCQRSGHESDFILRCGGTVPYYIITSLWCFCVVWLSQLVEISFILSQLLNDKNMSTLGGPGGRQINSKPSP